MKLFALVLGALALFAGFAGGARAYSVSAEAGPPLPTPVAAPQYPQAQPVRPGIVFRWAPCRPPAHRVGKACVTHVVHTVTLPAPTVAAATPQTAPAVQTQPRHVVRSTSSTSPSGDDGGHQEPGDDGGDDGGGGDD
jgi:hypothetical protein